MDAVSYDIIEEPEQSLSLYMTKVGLPLRYPFRVIPFPSLNTFAILQLPHNV